MGLDQIQTKTNLCRKAVSTLSGLSGLWKLLLVNALGLGSAITQTAAAVDADFAIGNKLAGAISIVIFR